MKVLNVVPVGDILLQLTSVAMEDRVTRAVGQPAKSRTQLSVPHVYMYEQTKVF